MLSSILKLKLITRQTIKIDSIRLSSLLSLKLSSNQRIQTQNELSERLKKKNQILIESKNINKIKQQEEQLRPSIKTRQKLNDKKLKKLIQNDLNNKDDENRLLELENDHLINNNLIPVYENKKKIESIEKDYLKKASFKIRNDLLDNNGRELLKYFPTLNKTSVDPKHLTLIHSDLSLKIANILNENIFKKNTSLNTSNIYIDFQPGFGLITNNLIKLNENNLNLNLNRQKFILIESITKYNKYLNDNLLINLNSKNININLLKSNPFHNSYLYEKFIKKKKDFIESFTFDDKTIKDVNVSIFGIVPWNTKHFLNLLYSSYCIDSGLFGLNKLQYLLDDLDLNINQPDFYLIIPEFLMAKLNSFYDKKYESFNSKLSLLSSLLSKVEVLDELKCDYFYPYPIVSKSYKYTNKFDNKKMFFVKIKFNSNDNEKNLVKHKRMLFLFLSQMYSRPSDTLNDALKPLCKDIDFVCRQVNVNKYLKLKMLTPFNCLKLFNYLIENEHVSLLNFNYKMDKFLNLAYNNDDNDNDDHEDKKKNNDQMKKRDSKSERKLEMKELKNFNKNLSGQFLIPQK